MTPQEKIAAADPARELLKRAKSSRREKPADGPSLLLQAVQLKIKERYGDGDPWQQMLVQSQQTGDPRHRSRLLGANGFRRNLHQQRAAR